MPTAITIDNTTKNPERLGSKIISKVLLFLERFKINKLGLTRPPSGVFSDQ